MIMQPHVHILLLFIGNLSISHHQGVSDKNKDETFQLLRSSVPY